MNGDNTGVFKKNNVSSTTHPHENSGATGVYQSKGNILYEFSEIRTGAPEIKFWRANRGQNCTLQTRCQYWLALSTHTITAAFDWITG